MTKRNCCKPVFFKHEDGWDIYSASECAIQNGELVPKWFDSAIVEDAKTKKVATEQFEGMHPLGICLV